jgi:cyclophilin family peptidyl-prolyl cis-trans isomerase/HEAT repeat protein
MMIFSRRIAAALLLSVLFTGCDDAGGPDAINPLDLLPTVYQNSWGNDTLRTIYTAQDQRDVTALLPYLQSDNPAHQQQAALAFASIQDTAATDQLSAMLASENEEVKVAAAYSLGQIAWQFSSADLWKAATDEASSLRLKAVAYEAFGKCGSEAELEQLVAQFDAVTDPVEQAGIMWGIYRLALNGVNGQHAVNVAMRCLGEGMAPDQMLPASHYLARARNINLSKQGKALTQAFERIENVDVRMSIARAMGKVKSATIFRRFIEDVFGGDYDYRVKVNAIYACRSFTYHWIPLEVVKLIDDENVQVAISAAEFLSEQGGLASELFYGHSKTAKHWRVKANLLKAALKDGYAGKALPKVKKMYEESDNVYEKGALLVAIGGHVSEMKFIGSELMQEENVVLKSYAMEALVTMRKSHGYEKAHLKYKKSKSGINHAHGFNVILESAIETGDAAVVAQAAGLLADTTVLDLSGYWRGKIDVLTTAQENCTLPREIETWLELQKAIDALTGNTSDPIKKTTEHPIDWDLVATIKSNQTALISTSKGDIELALLVDDAPGSVSNFVALLQAGTYHGGNVHRVVPNFVMQDGCPRGDGYGGPDYSIRSEFAPLRYGTGTVGMASAGPDTESSQWFITHSPTPHLDGRYSIIGHVSSGMEVVHLIGVGDTITSITLQ